MKNTMRILAALLAALMTFSAVACAGDGAAKDDSDDSSATTDEETTAETDEYDNARNIYSALPDFDYEGEDFIIACQKGVGSSESEIWVEQTNGDPINDAIYNRNAIVNERFNCTIKNFPCSVQNTVMQSVMSGDETYKLVFPSLTEAGSMAQAGYLLNYLDFENVNLNATWWDQGTANLDILGKVYFMSGDINILDNEVTYILLFNKKLFEDTGITEPYQMVRDGEWTIEVFSEMIKNITNDSDGDGKYTSNDTYGYVTTAQGPNTFFYGSDLMYVTLDGDKYPALTLNSEKTQILLEKMVKIFCENSCTYIPSDVATGMTMFKEDRVLFYGEVISYIFAVRDMETDFGILPIPKYDTDQENYNTYCESNSSTCCVPKVISDVDKVTAVMEAIAIQSYISVTPAYYDISLQRKYTRDDNSAEMLDIALSHRVYDLVRVYSNIGLSDMFQNLALAGNTGFASKYEMKYTKASKAIENICEGFENMEN